MFSHSSAFLLYQLIWKYLKFYYSMVWGSKEKLLFRHLASSNSSPRGLILLPIKSIIKLLFTLLGFETYLEYIIGSHRYLYSWLKSFKLGHWCWTVFYLHILTTTNTEIIIYIKLWGSISKYFRETLPILNRNWHRLKDCCFR